MGREVEIAYILDGDDLGAFFPDELRIEVKDDKDWKDHLLHEIIHAILWISGHSSGLTHKQEESIVRALENGLKPLIKLKI